MYKAELKQGGQIMRQQGKRRQVTRSSGRKYTKLYEGESWEEVGGIMGKAKGKYLISKNSKEEENERKRAGGRETRRRYRRGKEIGSTSQGMMMVQLNAPFSRCTFLSCCFLSFEKLFFLPFCPQQSIDICSVLLSFTDDSKQAKPALVIQTQYDFFQLLLLCLGTISSFFSVVVTGDRY